MQISPLRPDDDYVETDHRAEKDEKVPVLVQLKKGRFFSTETQFFDERFTFQDSHLSFFLRKNFFDRLWLHRTLRDD